MEEFDVIVIGSGVGGLAAAICLARSGKSVLVLEQHYVPGGWSHSFTLNGQRFSPGVHYVGLMEKGETTHEMYRGLGIANDLVFFRMNPNGYEHCVIGDRKISLPAGFENLRHFLSEKFPHEKKKIHKYLELVRNTNLEIQLMPKLKGWWQRITVPFRTPNFGKYALFPLKRVIGWHLKDPLLKAVLNIQCGDHGLPPARACFPVHCSVMSHYFGGGYYPMGGGGGIVKAMTNAVKRHGGKVRVKQNVSRILIRDKKACGVQLADGSEIRAKTVISNADPGITYLDLVGRENLSQKLVKKLEKTKYSVTSLILFLTIDMDISGYMDSGNIWMVRDEDIDKHFSELMEDDLTKGEEFPAVFISCTTIKDPASFNGRYHNIEVVTYVNYDKLPKFGDMPDYQDEVYSEFKRKVIDKLMNNVEKIIPGVKSHVMQAELGTPKTNEFYINSTKGNVYGTEKTLGQVGPFSYRHTTEIENLFLCGSSTLSHGVGGATFSGIGAAAAVLKCSIDDLLPEDESQKLRIYDAEDESSWPDWLHVKRSDKKRTFKEIV